MLGGGLVLQQQKAHNLSKDFPPWFFFPRSFFALDPQWNYGVLENEPYGAGTPYTEWQLKLSGAYLLPWDFSLGAFMRYEQGGALTSFGDVRSDRS